MRADDVGELADDVFLLLTARCSNEAILTDENSLAALLDALAKAIGMNPIQSPSLSRAVNNPGLEGYLPVDMSNITVSTYTSNPRLVACIHSCKPFEPDAVTKVLRKVAGCREFRCHFCRESEFGEPSA